MSTTTERIPLAAADAIAADVLAQLEPLETCLADGAGLGVVRRRERLAPHAHA